MPLCKLFQLPDDDGPLPRWADIVEDDVVMMIRRFGFLLAHV